MKKVISLARERERRVPHTCGRMVCELCDHRDISIAELGQRWFRCPKCKRNSFVRAEPVRPAEGIWRQACPACSEQSFAVMARTLLCSACGTELVTDWGGAPL